MAPRGNKSSAPVARGRGRPGPIASSRGGGIQKRRGTDRLRVDKDGDMVMGANASRGDDRSKRHGPSGPGTSKPSSRARQHAILSTLTSGGRGGALSARISQPGNLRTRSANIKPEHCATLQITGFLESKAASNEGGGMRALLGFIERKAPSAAKLARSIRVKKSRLEDPYVYILVAKQDVGPVLALNNFVFAGASLKIEEGPDMFNPPGADDGSSLSSGAQETKTKLKSVLHRRYNLEAKFLDLSILGEDIDLRGIGVFEHGSFPEKLFKALMKICDETFQTPEAKREAVSVVSLAGNALTDVQQVVSLADTFPDLKQLDLSNNQIPNNKGLSKWRNKFRLLEGLLVIDNPVCTESAFGNELLQWWPRLQDLNHVQARTPEQAAAAAVEAAAKLEAATKLQAQPVPHAAAVYMDESGVAEPFIRDLISGCDTSRAELAAKYYDQDSVFTLNVDTRGVKSMTNAETLPWTAYIRLSRNIVKITTKSGRQQRTFKGSRLISELWKSLPQTKHPDLSTEINKYIIECRPQDHVPDPSGSSPDGVTGLHITITGEFEELDAATGKAGRRSFTRSIVLGPGRPGAHPVRVVNDMLSLRCFRRVPPISEIHLNVQKIQELSQATRLTLGYAEMCLGDADYDYQVALRLFEEKKHQLPTEAFITNGM